MDYRQQEEQANMGRAIEAVYESGLLRPKVPVTLEEGQTVTVVLPAPSLQLRSRRDEHLRRHFGACRSGDTRSAGNDRIDADLAAACGNSNELER
jgi:predicted DNA-binding antitoxin AbrB/MazE fold protein